MGSHKDSKTMNVFRPLAFLFVGMLCSSVNMPIFAQEYADKGDPTSSQSVQKPDTDKQEAANEKDDKEKEKEKSKKKPSKLAGVVAAPLPISSPAIGSGIIPVLGYIFPFSTKDKISPPSVVGAAGLITDNGSRGFAVGAQLYLKEDRYRITSGYVHGYVDYNIYGF